MKSAPADAARLPLPLLETPAVTTCAGCGVCCTEQPLPPFLDDIDLIPPDLQREVLELQKMENELWERGAPCTWFDPRTKGCIHHEHRPNICREYEIGGELCLEIRQKYHVNT